MSLIKSIGSLTALAAISSSFTLQSINQPALAQTKNFVADHSRSIEGEVSRLSHVILVQVPQPIILDIGANQQTTLTVPLLSDMIINGQTIAPAQTPVLISIERDTRHDHARVLAKGLMLQGKLVALKAKGDAIPSFVIPGAEFNQRVKNAMNLGAIIGTGMAGTMGTAMLGQMGAAMGDPTGTGLAMQMTSAGGLAGIVGGIFGGKGDQRVIELPAGSTHVLTVENSAMVVAQLIQLNREVAAGNQLVMTSIASKLEPNEELETSNFSTVAESDQVAPSDIELEEGTQSQEVAIAQPSAE